MTRAGSETGCRYREHEARGSTVMLFTRRRTTEKVFWYLGRPRYVRHGSEKPVKTICKLDHRLPVVGSPRSQRLWPDSALTHPARCTRRVAANSTIRLIRLLFRGPSVAPGHAQRLRRAHLQHAAAFVRRSEIDDDPQHVTGPCADPHGRFREHALSIMSR